MTRPTSDEPDRLEAELQSLAPAAPSGDLRDRIARDLSAHAGTPRPRLWLAAGGLAAAACVVIGAALALRGIGTRDDTGAVPVVVTTAPATGTSPNGTAASDDRPALASYRRALARSPDDLDELLDLHAARSLGGTRSPAAARATASSNLGLLP
jgi:hypothetical protein